MIFIAFSDIFFLIIGAFVLIISVLVGMTVYDEVMGTLQPKIPVATYTSINDGVQNNTQFWNSALIVIVILFALVSVIFSAMISSNPVYLIGWLFLNLIMIFVWDGLGVVLDSFISGPLNTGDMSDAVNFFQNDLVKLLPIINVLIAVALFGKRVTQQ